MQKTLISIFLGLSVIACGGSDKNSPPVFSQSNYTFSVNEDSVIQGQVSATDPNNDSLSFSVGVTTNNGILTLNPIAGSFSYTPKANFHGSDTATIVASDGVNSTSTTLNFRVAAVNDSPVYSSHTLQSGNAGSILGLISASDVDGDSLNFSLVAQPALGNVALQQNGSFVYTPNELALIDDKFSVSMSDGKTTSTAEISLLSQYSTNLDKLSYYYASDLSHLKQAEKLAASLNDTATTDDIYEQLAVGYHQAGFTDRAQDLISDKVAQVLIQAQSYQSLGDVERNKGNQAQAKQFYNLAFETYNQAMAEKGFGNINANDASFYQVLSARLLTINESDLSKQVGSQLITIADSIRTPVYSTAYGRILVAYSNFATEQVQSWLVDKSADNLKLALDATEKLGYLAENTGYQVNSGLNVTSLKTLYLTATAKLYFRLNTQDKSKLYTAKAFADYNYFDGETPTFRSLDPAYDQPQGQYAKNTQLRYPAGMTDLIAMVAANFGDKHLLVKDLINKYGSATQKLTAEQNVQLYLAYQRLKNGEALGTVLTDLQTYYSSSPESYFKLLLNYTGDNLAITLQNQGLTTAAKQVAATALTVFASEAYTSEVSQKYSRPSLYTVGSRGCIGVADSLDQILGNHDGLASICDAHYALFDPAKSKYSTLQTLDSYRLAALMYQKIGSTFDKTALVKTLSEQSGLVSDRKTRIYETAQSAAVAALLGDLNSSRTLTNKALTDLIAYTANKEYGSKPADLNSALGYVASFLGHEFSGDYSSTDFSTALISFRRQAQLGSNATELQAMNKLFAEQLALLDTELNKLSANEQQLVASSRLTANLAGGRMDLAIAQVNSDVTAAAEKLKLNKMIAIHTALLDHFPQSDFASVDTDQDGKPNFFAPQATAEQIASSGLTLDDDADNDGVKDPLDKAPLDSSKS